MQEPDVMHEVSFWPGSPLSYTTTKLELYRGETLLSTATGFVFRFAGRYFLVTNYHVFSGIHPTSGRVLSQTGATPNRVDFHVAVSTTEARGEGLYFKPMSVPIVDDVESPLWIDERSSTRQNDYAALPLDPLVPELADNGTALRAIQGGRVTLRRGVTKPAEASTLVGADSAQHFYPAIGTTVYVLGYPQGIASSGIFPIWKGATIASEPLAGVTLADGDYDNVFYIDATTKSGMSGAPVVVLSEKGRRYYTEDNVIVEIGNDEPFLVGVYAGRDGVTNDEFELSLGRVWKVSALERLCMKAFAPPERVILREQ